MYSTTRRTVLKLGLIAGLAPIGGSFASEALAANRAYAPKDSDWRKFQLRTSVDLQPGQAAALWIPVPSLENNFQRTADNQWAGNAQEAKLIRDTDTGAQFLYATFDGSSVPHLELTSTIETRNRTVDWTRKSEVREDAAVIEAALKPSTLKPLDGIVTEAARKIVAGAETDLEKVKAIYTWIVQNCYRNLDTPGCGPGDNIATLTTSALGGKCADLNGLFVGLARASGVPARDVFGIRVAPSEFGYKQLGANSENVTGAQHCRAEVWLKGYGWVAMDPADVLKVMRAETDKWIKDPNDPLVAEVNAALFGSWEGNWVGYNTAEDLRVPGRAKGLPFMMYPQGTVGGAPLDELDAKTFSYSITAHAL